MSFQADITRFIERTGLRADQVLRKLGLDAFYGILKRSPVDTGRYRGNHRISINTVDERASVLTVSDAGPDDPPTGQEQAYATQQILKAKFGDAIIITNNLAYAVPLEDGHSGQAPNGVYSQTFEELVRNVGKAVQTIR